MSEYLTLVIIFIKETVVALAISAVKFGIALRLDIPILAFVIKIVASNLLASYCFSCPKRFSNIENPWGLTADDALEAVYSDTSSLKRCTTKWGEKEFAYIPRYRTFTFGCNADSNNVSNVTAVIHEGMHYTYTSKFPTLGEVFSAYNYSDLAMKAAVVFLIVALYYKSQSFSIAVMVCCAIAASRSFLNLIREIHANYRSIAFLKKLPTIETWHSIPDSDVEAQVNAKKHDEERYENAMKVSKITAVTGCLSYVPSVICTAITLFWCNCIYTIFF